MSAECARCDPHVTPPGVERVHYARLAERTQSDNRQHPRPRRDRPEVDADEGNEMDAPHNFLRLPLAGVDPAET